MKKIEIVKLNNQTPKILIAKKAVYLIVVDKDVSFKHHWLISKKAEIDIYYLFIGASGRLDLSYQVERSAKLNIKTLVLASGSENLMVDSNYNFIGSKSTGNLSAGIVLGGKAVVDFAADFNILSSAVDSETRVDLKLSLLSGESRGKLLPALRIAGNQLKTGHSASTWRLSESEEFYLRSRGLSTKDIINLWQAAAWREFSRDLPLAVIKSWEKNIKKYYDKL